MKFQRKRKKEKKKIKIENVTENCYKIYTNNENVKNVGRTNSWLGEQITTNKKIMKEANCQLS